MAPLSMATDVIDLVLLLFIVVLLFRWLLKFKWAREWAIKDGIVTHLKSALPKQKTDGAGFIDLRRFLFLC